MIKNKRIVLSLDVKLHHLYLTMINYKSTIKTSDLRIGISSYSQAIKLLFTPKFAIYLIFPLILNIIIFYLGNNLISNIIDPLNNYILDLLSLKGDQTGFLFYLKKFLSGLVWILIKVSFFVAYIFIGGYLIITLMSPVYAFLSEKTERHISGHTYKTSITEFLYDIYRGLLIALRNVLLELGWAILMFFASFIPLIGFLTPIVMFFITAYFYGFSFIDYSLERRRYKINESIRFCRQNRWTLIGNGTVFTLLLIIPIIGPTLAGFASLVAVMAATISTEKIFQNQQYTIND